MELYLPGLSRVPFPTIQSCGQFFRQPSRFPVPGSWPGLCTSRSWCLRQCEWEKEIRSQLPRGEHYSQPRFQLYGHSWFLFSSLSYLDFGTNEPRLQTVAQAQVAHTPCFQLLVVSSSPAWLLALLSLMLRPTLETLCCPPCNTDNTWGPAIWTS